MYVARAVGSSDGCSEGCAVVVCMNVKAELRISRLIHILNLNIDNILFISFLVLHFKEFVYFLLLIKYEFLDKEKMSSSLLWN
jgi:hypothetical protein